MKMPPTVANKQSELLNTDENLQVFRLLGNRCETMATTVVQLYITQPPNHSDWVLRNTGVLCFVKDSIHKSYFFRLYCLRTNQLVWQHEMYNDMEYKEVMSYLHVFEGDQYIVGFSFANNNEAYQFHRVVKNRIEMRRKRKEERRSRTLSQSQSLRIPPSIDNNMVPPKITSLSAEANNMFKKSPNPEATMAKRRRNFTKADIGTPTNFQHVSHIGWNASTGFDINTQDESLKHFFVKAGVSDQILEDRQTREFVYDFVNKHQATIIGPKNGISQNDDAPPPAVPPRGPTRNTTRAAPPPPPAMQRGGGPRIERTPSRPNHEPPRKPRPPSPPKTAPPVSSTSAPPPPPPPPPPPMDFSPPAPPSMGGIVPPPPPPLEAINNNVRMEASNTRSAPPSAAPVESPRSNLLQEIQTGIRLKPVDQREIRPPSSPSPGKEPSNASDLALVLRDRLKDFLDKRNQAINPSSDDSDTSDSNDDEWDN